jgi:hypothetical protein
VEHIRDAYVFHEFILPIMLGRLTIGVQRT